MRKKTVFLGGIVLMIFAMNSYAYCIYNDGRKKISVWGENCPRCYKGDIQPGEKGCCPGDKSGCKGNTWITYTGPHTPNTMYYCTAEVPARGWVRIRNDGNPDACVFFDANGKELTKDRSHRLSPGNKVKTD
jgi:hypothetical protein